MLNRTTLEAHYAETDLNIEAPRKQTIKFMSANFKTNIESKLYDSKLYDIENSTS